VVLEIVSSDYKANSYPILSLSKIMLISLNLEIGRYLLFPSLVGIDPFKHMSMVRLILEGGGIPEGMQYSAFPGFHIDAAALSVVAALPSPKVVLYLTSGSLSIVTLMVIFGIARVFLGVRGSLLATLCASFTTWLVQARFEMLPQLMGYSLFAYIIYLVIAKNELKFRGLLVFLLFASITVIHTLSSLVTSLCLATVVIGWRLVAPLREGQARALLFSILFLTSYWFLASGFSDFVVVMVAETLSQHSLLSFPLHFLSWVESDVSWLGTYVIYWLAIFGCLGYLSHRKRTPEKVSLVVSVVGLFGVSYIFLLVLSSYAIVPDRWFGFGLTLAVIPASYAAISLVKLGSRRSRSAILLVLVFFLLTFSSITSTFANDDSPFFGQNVMRLSFTANELQSADVLNGFYRGLIATDTYYAQAIFNQTLNNGHLTGHDLTEINTGMLNGSKPIEGLIVIRMSGFNTPVRFLTGYTYAAGVYSPYFYILGTYDRDFLQKLVSRGNVVYSSQSVIAVLIPSDQA
jgi:hypothetical protein